MFRGSLRIALGLALLIGVACQRGRSSQRDAGGVDDGGVDDAGQSAGLVPDAPRRVSAGASKDGAFIDFVAPNDHGSPILGYRVLIDRTGGEEKRDLTTAAPSGVDLALDVGAYTFRVLAFNANGDGPPSDPTPQVLVGPPPPKITAPASVASDAKGIVASVVAQPGLTYQWIVFSGLLTSDPAGQLVNGLNQITFDALPPNDSGSSYSIGVYCTATESGIAGVPSTATINVAAPPRVDGFAADDAAVLPGSPTRLLISTRVDPSSLDIAPATTGVYPFGNAGRFVAFTYPLDEPTRFTLTVHTGTDTLVEMVDVGILAVDPKLVPLQHDRGGPLGSTAVKLNDGRVLIAGAPADLRWDEGIAASSTAELFDPAAHATSALCPLQSPREGASSILLPDGRALIVGGGFFGFSNSSAPPAEIFDPHGPDCGAQSPFTSVGANQMSLLGPLLAVLPSGRVVIAGGMLASPLPPFFDVVPSKKLTVFDPAAGTFNESAVVLPGIAEYGDALLLGADRVLLVGEWDSSHGVIYDSANDSLARTAGTAPDERAFAATALLADGSFLIAGGEIDGNATATAMTFDPATGVYSATGGMATARSFARAARLADGRVAVIGGTAPDGKSLASVELYDPVRRTFSTATPLVLARSEPSVVKLDDGSVFVLGPGDVLGSYRYAEIWTE